MVKCIKGKKGEAINFTNEQRERGNPQTYYIYITDNSKKHMRIMATKLLEVAQAKGEDFDSRPLDALIKFTTKLIDTEGRDDLELTYDEIVALTGVKHIVEAILSENIDELMKAGGIN